MQDNEFEKQVHQKLTGLTVEGGEAVWERVEAKLDEKDKRRRWLIWIPVGVAGLFIAGLLLFQYKPAGVFKGEQGKETTSLAGKQSPRAGAQSTLPEPVEASREINVAKSSENSKKTSPRPVQDERSTDNRLAPRTIRSHDDQASAETISAHTNGGLRRGIGAGGRDRSRPVPTEQTLHQNLTRTRGLADDASSKGSPTLVPPDEFEPSEPAANEPTVKEPTVNRPIVKEANEAMLKDTFLQEARLKAGLPVIIDPPHTEEALKKSALIPAVNLSPAIRKKDFEWGINLSIARSSIASGKIINLFGGQASYSPNYSVSNGGALSSFNGPSEVRPGMSGGIGLFGKKRLNEHWYLTVGLNYSAFSTSMKVGAKKVEALVVRTSSNMDDKSLQSYYTSDNNSRYLNRYHFLELPLALGVDLIKPSKVQLSWEFGLAPSRLVASNALHYSANSTASSPIYYQDNSLFHKTQFRFFTALPFTFVHSSAYSLQLVPGFSYNSSALLRSVANGRQHFIVSGISARILF